MTAYAYNSDGWYVGQVPKDTPNSTPIAPPILDPTMTPGAPRSVWARVAWYVVAVPYPITPPTPVVPRVVEPFYFVTALDSVMSLGESDIDTAIAAMPTGKPKRRLKSWWSKASMFRRNGADVAALAALMVWTPAQVDALFFAADAAMSAEA